MNRDEISRAISAALSIASEVDLVVTDTIVLHNSNKLTLHLRPCDVAARIAPVGQEMAQSEIDTATRLAQAQCPVATVAPRVGGRRYERDGFVVTFWTYYEPFPTTDIAAVDYARALARLHAGMRTVDTDSANFSDRVAEAHHLVRTVELTPGLTDVERKLLTHTLDSSRQLISSHGYSNQMLHGEPHPGNVLNTDEGPLFIDFETCCRGPVEFDLAHVPHVVVEHYPGVDLELLSECRRLVLAMVAAWRWDLNDQFPGRTDAARRLLNALRDGPPWPTLDAVMQCSSASG